MLQILHSVFILQMLQDLAIATDDTNNKKDENKYVHIKMYENINVPWLAVELHLDEPTLSWNTANLQCI